MKNAKRGSGSHRWVYVCAAAALGFALSGCGGGGSGAAGASTSQSGLGMPPTANNGAVTLNWTPPTENTDGTPLTNLAGYDIHYGTSAGSYTQTVTVNNPGIATYVVDNLAPGTYYFSVSAVNSSGTESPASTPVTATVN